MALCCPDLIDSPLMAERKWGLLYGGWQLHNRCPCWNQDDGCKIELKPIPGWNGWCGGIFRRNANGPPPTVSNIAFFVYVSCDSSGVYRLQFLNSSDCGQYDEVVGGTCNNFSYEIEVGPTGGDCCGSWGGEAVSNRLTIVGAEPVLPDWRAPKEPTCDIWCTDPCNVNCCPTGTPPADPEGNPECCEVCGSGSCVNVVSGGHSCGSQSCSSPVSMAPIQYATGAIDLRVTDLQSEGLGFLLAHTRSFASRLSVSTDPGNGYNWFVRQWPRLHRMFVPGQASARIAVMGDATGTLWFAESGSDTFTADFGDKSTLTLDRTAHVFRLRTISGTVTEFDQSSGIALRATTGTGQTLEVAEWAAEGTQPAILEQGCNRTSALR